MKRNLEISFEHFDNTADMDVVDQVLISEAENATENANAPYSNFRAFCAVHKCVVHLAFRNGIESG